jgi:hypothetical protein
LERILGQFELHYVVRDDVLLITTPDQCEQRLDTYLYDVRPLIDDDLGLTDEGTLTDLITSTIDMQSWDEVGGPGSVEHFRGLLVVTQTGDVHRKLAGLFEQMDRHCLRRMSPGGEKPARIVRILPDEAEDQIEAALLQPIGVQFDNVPLAKAAANLSELVGVPIVLDRHVLEDVSVAADAATSVSAKEMTLGGVLDRLVEPLQLSWTIRNRQIVISGPEDYYWRLQTRLYDVQDILPANWQQAEPACDQLMLGVEPNYWDISGGPGSYFHLGRGWLVVSADTARHLSLADKLHELRTGQKTQRAQEREELQAAREKLEP